MKQENCYPQSFLSRLVQTSDRVANISINDSHACLPRLNLVSSLDNVIL